MTLQEMTQVHPVPWRFIAQGGNVQVIDGLGQPVELFEMLDFVAAVTAQMAAERAAKVAG